MAIGNSQGATQHNGAADLFELAGNYDVFHQRLVRKSSYAVIQFSTDPHGLIAVDETTPRRAPHIAAFQPAIQPATGMDLLSETAPCFLDPVDNQVGAELKQAGIAGATIGVHKHQHIPAGLVGSRRQLPAAASVSFNDNAAQFMRDLSGAIRAATIANNDLVCP